MTDRDEPLGALVPDPAAQARLTRYVRLLLDRNASVNLTAARGVPDALDHVRDSLAIANWIASPYVDVGSGGGFPAIPLAIATGARATLIEAVGKKAAFLRDVVAELALDVRVVDGRAEDAARDPDLRETFASATARAVGNVPVVLELTVPLLRVGGIAVLQRGRFDEPERRATADALLVLGAELMDEVAGGNPGDERRVLLIRKTRPTQHRFPRRAGIPAKRPLCSDG